MTSITGWGISEAPALLRWATFLVPGVSARSLSTSIMEEETKEQRAKSKDGDGYGSLLCTGMDLPEDIKAALDEKVYAHVATVNPDGSPQVSVVWITRRDNTVLFSTAAGRIKPRNIAADPRVALSFTPPNEPYKNITMQGTVIRTETDGTWLIDELANKYLGHESYQYGKPGEVRVNYEIEIESMSTWG